MFFVFTFQAAEGYREKELPRIEGERPQLYSATTEPFFGHLQQKSCDSQISQLWNPHHCFFQLSSCLENPSGGRRPFSWWWTCWEQMACPPSPRRACPSSTCQSSPATWTCSSWTEPACPDTDTGPSWCVWRLFTRYAHLTGYATIPVTNIFLTEMHTGNDNVFCYLRNQRSVIKMCN